MYTYVVRKKQEPSTELGRFMRQWRMDQQPPLTIEAAAGVVGIAKSTWSKLERGQRFVSLETLIALSERTTKTVDELTAMLGERVIPSKTNEERARRAAALAEKVPAAAALLGLLPELTPQEVDTLLSVGESFVRQRKARK